jgi:hypothetical protein
MTTTRKSPGSDSYENQRGERPSAKRLLPPYETPRLERYGRLADLTRQGGSVPIDSGGGLGQGPPGSPG